MYLVLAAFLFGTERTARMPDDAARQQEGEWTIFSLTIAAAVFSLVAVFDEFANTSSLSAEQKTLRIVLVVVTLFASWLMTHTSFALRYAHEYYSRDEDGKDFDRGLEFPGEASRLSRFSLFCAGAWHDVPGL